MQLETQRRAMGLMMADTPHDPRRTLDLLVPWDLPLDQPLVGPERECISQALRQCRWALDESDASQACRLLDQALAALGAVASRPAVMATTRTPLSVEDVVDYDHYFGIQHVHTLSAALCLVQGLLVTCQTFLTLCGHVPQLSPEHLEQQKQGFRRYISLLARVFHLTDQDMS